VATHRPDLSRFTISQLADMTGRDAATVRKRLDGLEPVKVDGRARWYDPRTALPRIFGDGEGLDLTAERARLAREQADGQALKNAELRGELVPGSDQAVALIALATSSSARLQAVPAKVAAECAAESSPHGCQAIVEREIRSALEDLAEAGRRASEDEEERRARADRDAAAAEAQRPRVGRTETGTAAGLA
jgi:phage terminase Nu1 subunit (DNA packaging protein)